MRILFVSTFFPHPLDNGARIRIYHLLRGLSEKHEVDLVAFMPEGSAAEGLPGLRQWLHSVQVINRDPFWRDPKKQVRAHFSLSPRDAILGFSPEMVNEVKQANGGQKYQVVISSILNAAPYAIYIKDTPRILEEHNFTTRWMEERFRKQIKQANLSSWGRKLAGWITWKKCLRYESNLYPQFNSISMVSQQDLLAVRQSIPRYSGQLAVIPNGVDLETRRPGLAEPVADTIVFNGSLAYQANLEGFQFFYFQVLPLIWNARANVKIIVTGSLNNVNLDWLTPDPRIVLTGYLDDARCSVASSWISIAPLLDGGGTRLKILEAMALGTPVIATTKGAEGLEIVPGEHLLIENEPEAFASACIRLLGTPGLRRRLTERAHRLVEAKYGWQQIGHRFRDMVEETALCKVGNN